MTHHHGSLIREAVLQEMDSSSDSIFFHCAEFGETFVPDHCHSRGQLIYTEGGRVYISIENRQWYLPARHCMWIPPGVKHSIKISQPNVLLWSVYFPAWTNEPAFYKKAGIYPVSNLLLEQISFTKNWSGHIFEKDQSRYYIAAAIKSVLPELNDNSLPFDLPLPHDERLAAIVEYMQNNLSESLTVTALARKFGMSESTLSRLFKNDLRMSFINYLGMLRIVRSVELLATGKMNIKEICFEVGYESVPSFSNNFKKSVGVRPTTYLKVS